jgi:GAF domain-containing protein
LDDPQRLSEVFVELADTLVADFDVVDFMTVLSLRCVEVLGASEAGVLLADADARLRSVASSHESARLLDLFELQADEGPCVTCFRSGAAVVNHRLDDGEQRWPKFSGRARELGFDVVHALPMRLRGEVVGAVNVFTAGPQHLGPADVAVGQALADVATIGLLHQRTLREATRLSEQLQRALTSRVVLEQAKGMLAEQLGVDMDQAFAILRQHSQATNQKLVSVAEQLLARDLDAEELRSPR